MLPYAILDILLLAASSSTDIAVGIVSSRSMSKLGAATLLAKCRPSKATEADTPRMAERKNGSKYMDGSPESLLCATGASRVRSFYF